MDNYFLEYCKSHENLYFACLWPAADDALLREQAIQMLRRECGEIIYEKDIFLGYNGLFHLMLQIYAHQGWTGTYQNKHIGTKGKADKCYLPGKSTHIAIFECPSFEQVTETKKRMRDLFSDGNDAVHISDNDEETRLMAELLLNANSLHHLRYGNPDSCTNFNRLFHEYRSKIINYAGRQDYIIDSSSVLAVYGLRDCRDLDFLTTDPEWEKILQGCGEIDNHDSQLRYYKAPLRELLNNPQNYFVYQGIKFVSLFALKDMKQRRSLTKDKYDVRIIRRFEKKGKMFSRPMPLKKERQQIKAKDIIMSLKCKRKELIESILKHRLPGKILLTIMHPMAKMMRKEDKWKNYYRFWEEQR